jgi:Papain family cysteine protease
MGVVLDPNEIVYPPKWSREAAASKVVVVPPEQRAYITPELAKQHEEMRLGPNRAVYWRGVDWRELGDRCRGILEPFKQAQGEDCVGPAVAAALRLNLAIHRGKDFGKLSREFVTAISQARGALPRSPVTGMLEDALTAVDQYGTPAAGELKPQQPKGTIRDFITDNFAAAAKHKAQGFDRLGSFLGQWSAWVHFSGPIVVQMNIERAPFDALEKAPAPHLIQYTHGREGKSEELPAGSAPKIVETTKYASHVVVVLGYIPYTAQKNPDTFIVLNSFGDTWGDKGIAYIDVKTAQKCFIAAYGFTFREHFGYTYTGKKKCFSFIRRVSAPKPRLG